MQISLRVRNVNGYRGFSTSNNSTVYEHRMIVEKLLGRNLQSEEHVHHKNGKRDDNRPENLEVFSRSNHAKYHANLKSTKIEIACKICRTLFSGYPDRK